MPLPETLSHRLELIQQPVFPHLEDAIGPLLPRCERFILILETVLAGELIPHRRRLAGPPAGGQGQHRPRLPGQVLFRVSDHNLDRPYTDCDKIPVHAEDAGISILFVYVCGMFAFADSIIPGNVIQPLPEDAAQFSDRRGSAAVKRRRSGSRQIESLSRQMALLFAAACEPKVAPEMRAGTTPEYRHCRGLILFPRGEADSLGNPASATIAVFARRARAVRERAVDLTRPGLSRLRKQRPERTPRSFRSKLPRKQIRPSSTVFRRPAERISAALLMVMTTDATLAKTVLSTHPNGSLRNELVFLRFAKALLEQVAGEEPPPGWIAPDKVKLKLTRDRAAVAGPAALPAAAPPKKLLQSTGKAGIISVAATSGCHPDCR